MRNPSRKDGGGGGGDGGGGSGGLVMLGVGDAAHIRHAHAHTQRKLMEGEATAGCYCGQIVCCIPPFLHDDTTWRQRTKRPAHDNNASSSSSSSPFHRPPFGPVPPLTYVRWTLAVGSQGMHRNATVWVTLLLQSAYLPSYHGQNHRPFSSPDLYKKTHRHIKTKTLHSTSAGLAFAVREGIYRIRQKKRASGLPDGWMVVVSA